MKLIKFMKRSFLKILFNVVSFIVNCTKGAKPFVRWKTALGILILGLSTTASMNSCSRKITTCYVTDYELDSPTEAPLDNPLEKNPTNK